MGSDDEICIRLDLKPRTFVRDDAGRHDDLHRAVYTLFEVETRRAAELADNNAFASIDNERSLVGHEGQIAEINLGFDNLSLSTTEANNRFDRRFKSHVTISALLDGVLGFTEREANELYVVGLCKIPDWAESCEEFWESLFQKPLV